MSGLTNFLMMEVELPLIPIVADMEDNGYKIACDHFQQIREKVEPEIDRVQKRIRKVAGPAFNARSSKQLQKLLYETLKLPVTKRTKNGQPSTDNSVLEQAAKEHVHSIVAWQGC